MSNAVTPNNTTRITNERRIAFGPQDQLMNMSRTKYKWATEIYDRMEANTWFPKSIPLVADRETKAPFDPDGYRIELIELDDRRDELV